MQIELSVVQCYENRDGTIQRLHLYSVEEEVDFDTPRKIIPAFEENGVKFDNFSVEEVSDVGVGMQLSSYESYRELSSAFNRIGGVLSTGVYMSAGPGTFGFPAGSGTTTQWS